MKTRKHYGHLWATILLVSILCMIVSMPAFAADKVLRYKVNFSGKTFTERDSEEAEKCTYDFGIFNTASIKVGKTIELSGDILIPTKLFKNNASYVDICTNFGVNGNKSQNYKYLAGVDNTRHFTVTKSGKVKCYNKYTRKSENASKYCTLKKKSGYYIIHFVDKLNVDKNEIFNGSKKQFANKKINPGMYVIVGGSGLKPGYVYLDNLMIKTGSSSIKVTFNKKDYREYSYMWRGNWKGKMHPSNADIVKKPV